MTDAEANAAQGLSQRSRPFKAADILKKGSLCHEQIFGASQKQFQIWPNVLAANRQGDSEWLITFMLLQLLSGFYEIHAALIRKKVCGNSILFKNH